METLSIIHTILIVVCSIFLIFTLISKSDIILSSIISIDCMLISFIGFMTYSSLSLNYPNRKTLALICALLWIIPFVMDMLKNKYNKIKPIFIKTSITLVFIINIALMLFL